MKGVDGVWSMELRLFSVLLLFALFQLITCAGFTADLILWASEQAALGFGSVDNGYGG